jgi:hypothetical protein
VSHWTVKGDALGLDDYKYETGWWPETPPTWVFEEAAQAAMEHWESGGSFAGDPIPDDVDLVVVQPNGTTRTVHMTVQYEVSFRGSIK